MSLLDSFRFLSESLDCLSKSLTDFDFNILRERFPDDSKIVLLWQKGYNLNYYIDSFEKFNKNKLPSFCASKEDVETAKEVWKTFQ